MPISTDSYERTYSANSAVSVTPSDTTDLGFTRAVYVGSTGDVAVTMVDGTSVVLRSVPTGAVLPIAVSKIKSTGTTATLIVAFK